MLPPFRVKVASGSASAATGADESESPAYAAVESRVQAAKETIILRIKYKPPEKHVESLVVEHDHRADAGRAARNECRTSRLTARSPQEQRHPPTDDQASLRPMCTPSLP